MSNDAYNNAVQEGLELLDALYKKKDKVTEIISTTEHLKTNVMTFMGERLNDINQKEMLTRLLDAEIVRKLALHELTTEEVMEYRKIMSTDKNISTQSILDLFKPSNSPNQSPFMPPIRATDDADGILESLTSEQRTALNKLMLILGSKTNTRKVEEEEGN